jgi:hypothetical protein
MRSEHLFFPLRSAALGVALLASAASADEARALRVGWSAPAANGLPAGWRPLTFRNIPSHTRYTLVREGEEWVVRAESKASASGLIYPLGADARRTPILRWRWKVENLLAKSDVTRKEGDDYPARIYVAFAYDPKRAGFAQRLRYEAARLIYGEYPPHAGLSYIWESKAPVDTVAPNPFSDRVRMFVVDSGAGRLGQWVEHQRNIHEDYKAAFGEEPPMIAGIAIMTDTDQTAESAVAYYGEIVLGPPQR